MRKILRAGAILAATYAVASISYQMGYYIGFAKADEKKED